MRFIVTGGAGFIPSHLSERLLCLGHEVVAVDNFCTGSRANIAHLMDEDAYTFIEADLCDDLPDVGRFDRIFHMASPASPVAYANQPFATLYVNSHGAQHCLEAAERYDARFLMASTSEVYGDPAIHPQVESYWGNVNPNGPRSVYDEGKRYAEALTMAFHRYRGVQTRIIRIFNTYGPRMQAGDGRVIPAFVNQALRGQPLTVFGDGTQTRSFCYVSDLVEGLIKLMESDLVEPCNIGNPYELTMLQLAEKINEITSNPAGIVHRPLPKDDPTRRKPDITRARTLLGWEPTVQFSEGIGHTIAYFREQQALERR